MKKGVRLIALGGILALSIPAFLALSQNTKSVSAYNASSLPTTIDLNDSTASDIRSYYSSLNNLSTSERQGTNLLKNFCNRVFWAVCKSYSLTTCWSNSCLRLS